MASWNSDPVMRCGVSGTIKMEACDRVAPLSPVPRGRRCATNTRSQCCYRLLSIRDVRLPPEAFAAAMRTSNSPFTQWRLSAHDDTDYAHAHVIAFSNRPIPKRMIVGWSSRHAKRWKTCATNGFNDWIRLKNCMEPHLKRLPESLKRPLI